MRNINFQKIVINSLPSLIFPLIFLFILEVLLASLYKFTSFKYFENFNQTYERCCSNDNAPDNDFNKLKAELSSNKKKIAIFGGSSSAGYASSKSFDDFLKDSLESDYLIHNYAQSGASFYRNQADILKVVIPFYDVLIIYAGHNEVWQVLYDKALKFKSGYIMPNKQLVDKRQVLNALNEPKKRIKLVKLAADGRDFSININNFLRKLVLPNFIIRTGRRINLAINSTIQNKNIIEKINYQNPFFVKEKVINSQEKISIIKNFEKEVETIISLIREDQTLIISTVLSNDIYPPNLDFISSNKSDSAIVGSKVLENIYNEILTKGYINNDEVKKLSPGAQSEYLNSLISCNIVPTSLDNTLDKKCLRLLKEVRGKDHLPYRVLPEINSYILSLKDTYPNVKIIDPYVELNNSTTIKEYLSYFVDFQHPSLKGHALISKKIMNKIPPFVDVDYKLTDKCDSYDLIKDNSKKSFKANINHLNNSLVTNISWLEDNIKYSSAPFIHEFYLEMALKKKEICN